jgi:hypothetical protein
MKLFFRTLNENTSKESYGYKFQKFMRFAVENKWCKNNEDFDPLLILDSDKVTDILSDYVDFLEDGGDRNVGTDLASPELFFQNNRKIWHRELVRGGIKRDTAIAWKLSIRGCLKFMLNANSEPIAYGDNIRYSPDENEFVEIDELL